MEPPVTPFISRIAVSERPIVTPRDFLLVTKSIDVLSAAAILMATSRLSPSTFTPGRPVNASLLPLPFRAVQLRVSAVAPSAGISLNNASWKLTCLRFTPIPLTPTKASRSPAPKANILVFTDLPSLVAMSLVASSRVKRPLTSKKPPTFRLNMALALRKSPSLPFMSRTVGAEPNVTPRREVVLSKATTVPSADALLSATSMEVAEMVSESPPIPTIPTDPA